MVSKMKPSNTCFVFLVLLSVWAQIFADDLVVKLNNRGEIRGSILKTQKGRTIYAFRGIPYAEPPTGELRFKPPISKTPWKGQIFDASKNGPACPQIDPAKGVYMGQEDCLHLNVYTTMRRDQIQTGTKMAVMVFIHGGGFTTGSSTERYGPGLLLDEDVVLVALNYRLGPFGFLSTGDEVSQGNYGLMDQTLALKWVNDQIDVFGGDTNKITIFGESAGSGSVELHLLSPMSAGLFHNAIAQSGSVLCPCLKQKDPLYLTKSLAASFECTTKATSAMVECLKEIPAIDIIKEAKTFVPTVGGPFLPDEPQKILESGRINKVPYLGGLNKDEGLHLYLMLYLTSNTSTLEKNTEKTISNVLDNMGNADDAAKLVMEKYFSHIDWSDEEATRRAISQVFTDGLFSKWHYKMVKLLNQNEFNTYTYSLDYSPSIGILSEQHINENWGVAHADDLGFLFDGPTWHLKNATADDKRIMEVFCSSWANFAKYSDPTPNRTQDDPLKWKLSTGNKMQIYHIDNPVTTSVYFPDKDDMYRFWTETIPHILNNHTPFPHKPTICHRSIRSPFWFKYETFDW